MRLTLPLAALLGLLPALAHAQSPQATAPHSPGFRQWARTGHPAVGPERGADGLQQVTADEERIGVVLHTGNADALVRAGLRIESRYPTFVTARMTRAEAVRWVEHPSVQSLEAGVELVPDNDEAAALVGVRALREGLLGGSSYTGAGTIVCVIDSGIDYTHPTFRSISDPTQSRILRIWDQTITAVGAEVSPSGFSYGVEYTQAHLNDELDGSPALFVRQTDSNGHGTHVAGTAAGNGNTAVPALHVGMAPEADIVFVKAGNGSFPTANTIDGLSYCDAVGTAEGKPVVVNMSLGSDFGPHDGTDVKNLAVTSFSTSKPGRVVAQSAGNSGGTPLHRGGTVAAGDSVSLTFTIPTYTPVAGDYNDNTYFDVWFDTGSNIRVKLISPTGLNTVEQAPGGETEVPHLEGVGYLFNFLDPANLDRRIIVGVDDLPGSQPVAGVWTMRFINDGATADGFHAYHYDRAIGNPAVAVAFAGADATNTVSNAATGGFAVGSWVHRHRWGAGDNGIYSSGTDRTDLRAASSSQGPSRDGRTMPTISAPGMWVISARSAASSVQAAQLLTDSRWMANNGTSMASPVVAGAVALLFQQNPALTFAQVQSLVTDNARVDASVGVVPNNEFGAGKLDIYQAMARLVDGASTSVQGVQQYDGIAAQALGLNLGQSLSLKFQSPLATAGRLRGLMMQTHTQRPSGGYDLQIWTDNAGQPGTQLGTTVNVPLTHIKSGTWSYFDLSSLGVDLATGTEYHATVTPLGSAGAYYGDASTTTNRTLIRSAPEQPFGAITRDALLRVFVSSGASALPVELVAFEGASAGRRAALSWTTASETNNAGWALETLGSDGETWRELRFVRGAGTSSEARRYYVETADLVPGRHSFRLRQMDLDGTATVSGVVTVEVGIERALTVALAGPNPSREGTAVVFTVPTDGTVRAEVVDLLGRRVATLFAGEATAGRAHRLAVETGTFGAGIYVVRIEHGGRTVQQRIAVAR